MRRTYGLGFRVALLVVGVLRLAGCYAHACPPGDRSCLPCGNPASTNPTCVPLLNDDNVIPLDAKRPDGGPR